MTEQRRAAGAKSNATNVSGAGVGDTGAAGNKSSANPVAAMGVASSGEGGSGIAGTTGTSTATATMVATTAAGATLTICTASHKYKTDETQETIILPSPTANLD